LLLEPVCQLGASNAVPIGQTGSTIGAVKRSAHGTVATAILILGLSAAGLTRQAEPAAQNTRTYEARCASCHGATMQGGSAGPILTYVRYHTDADLTARMPVVHTGANGVQVSADDLKKA